MKLGKVTAAIGGIGVGLVFALAGGGMAQADDGFGIPPDMSGTSGGLSDLAIGIGLASNNYDGVPPAFAQLAAELHQVDATMPYSVEYQAEDLSLGQWAGFGGLNPTDPSSAIPVPGFDSGLAVGSGFSGSPGDTLLFEVDKSVGSLLSAGDDYDAATGTATIDGHDGIPALAALIDGSNDSFWADPSVGNDIGLAASAFVVDLGDL
ncbi:MAG TPA: hypothetical protein VFR17_05690 [Mycobacterium sp.]|nr:hypothetical protein [Mycobacterium sp.]